MSSTSIKQLNVKKKSACIELLFADETKAELSFELLRVYSPSAEVRAHHGEHYNLQIGKKEVGIKAIENVGNYGIQIHFDDGHNTGIYSWAYLYDLAVNQADYWQRYLAELKKANKSRYAGAVQVIDFKKQIKS